MADNENTADTKPAAREDEIKELRAQLAKLRIDLKEAKAEREALAAERDAVLTERDQLKQVADSYTRELGQYKLRDKREQRYRELRAKFEADPANKDKIVKWDRVERNLERFVTDPDKLNEGIAAAIAEFTDTAPPADNSSVVQGYGPARREAGPHDLKGLDKLVVSALGGAQPTP
jgi:chromosome segregation ATPase